MPPFVSIVVPVYNVGPYIQDTLASLLKQTYPHFEVLVLDDCSTDDTVARVQAIADARIQLIRNPRNLGRAGTDNAALVYVKGEYVAKMDGDDLCHPDRLRQQVAILEQRPEINVVGSWMQNFGSSTYLNQYPELPAEAQALTLFTLPTGNPSVMLRTSLLREQGMHYDGSLRQTEDYDFFARYVRQLRIYTVQAPLIQYRVPPDRQKKTVLTERASVADTVRADLLAAWGVQFTEQELAIHNSLAMLTSSGRSINLDEVEKWLHKLLDHNERTPWFEPTALQRCLGQRWFEACYTFPLPRLQGAVRFYQSPLATAWKPALQQHMKLWVRSAQNF